MTFTFDITKDVNINIVRLSGELIDKNQANDLISGIDDLIDNKESKIIFDLGELKYINSSGLNILINVLTKARKSGGEVVITNVSKKVNELFLITKLNTVFTVTESLEKAISKLK